MHNPSHMPAALNTIRAPALLLALLMAASTLVVATPALSQAATNNVVVANDPPADAFIARRKGITLAQKRSVDIRRTTVQRVDSRARFIIKIRDVMRRPRFDQMFFIRMREHTNTPGGAWIGDVGFTSKGRYSYAIYSNESGTRYNECGVAISIRPIRNEVVATVPWRCVPEGPLRISVDTYTGTFRSDAPWFSRDRQVVSGWHTILPLY